MPQVTRHGGQSTWERYASQASGCCRRTASHAGHSHHRWVCVSSTAPSQAASRRRQHADAREAVARHDRVGDDAAEHPFRVRRQAARVEQQGRRRLFVDAFLDADFEGGRHGDRVAKINALDGGR